MMMFGHKSKYLRAQTSDEDDNEECEQAAPEDMDRRIGLLNGHWKAAEGCWECPNRTVKKRRVLLLILRQRLFSVDDCKWQTGGWGKHEFGCENIPNLGGKLVEAAAIGKC